MPFLDVNFEFELLCLHFGLVGYNRIRASKAR